MIPILEPIFRGPWAAYGESLACSPCPPPHALPVTRLLAGPEVLDELLQRHAAHLGSTDLRPVASAWSLHYLWALLPPVVAAASLLRHAFAVQPGQMWVEFDADGEARRFHVADSGRPCPQGDSTACYEALLWQHLALLFEAVGRRARLPAKILWGNAARYLDSIFEQGLLLSRQADAVARDRERLLEQPAWPDGRANPLYSRARQVLQEAPGGATRLTLHRQCCLYYLLPGEGYCVACPLAPQYRRLTAAAAGG